MEIYSHLKLKDPSISVYCEGKNKEIVLNLPNEYSGCESLYITTCADLNSLEDDIEETYIKKYCNYYYEFNFPENGISINTYCSSNTLGGRPSTSITSRSYLICNSASSFSYCGEISLLTYCGDISLTSNNGSIKNIVSGGDQFSVFYVDGERSGSCSLVIGKYGVNIAHLGNSGHSLLSLSAQGFNACSRKDISLKTLDGCIFIKTCSASGLATSKNITISSYCELILSTFDCYSPIDISTSGTDSNINISTNLGRSDILITSGCSESSIYICSACNLRLCSDGHASTDFNSFCSWSGRLFLGAQNDIVIESGAGSFSLCSKEIHLWGADNEQGKSSINSYYIGMCPGAGGYCFWSRGPTSIHSDGDISIETISADIDANEVTLNGSSSVRVFSPNQFYVCTESSIGLVVGEGGDGNFITVNPGSSSGCGVKINDTFNFPGKGCTSRDYDLDSTTDGVIVARFSDVKTMIKNNMSGGGSSAETYSFTLSNTSCSTTGGYTSSHTVSTSKTTYPVVSIYDTTTGQTAQMQYIYCATNKTLTFNYAVSGSYVASVMF